jgi:hypothetical protein
MSKIPFPDKLGISTPTLPAFLPPIVATAILSFAFGYWIGAGTPPFGPPKKPHIEWKSSSENRLDNSPEITSEEGADWTKNHNHKAISQEECKLV